MSKTTDYIIDQYNENLKIKHLLEDNYEKHYDNEELREKLKDIDVLTLYKKLRMYYDNLRNGGLKNTTKIDIDGFY